MAHISVYAQFPKHLIKNNDQLYLDPANWAQWTHVLTFPIDTVNALNFSHNPLKWIRYCTGVVLGARGDLHTSRHPHVNNRTNYLDPLPTEDTNFYYHVALDAEKLLMFPIDPKLGDKRIMTSSRATTRRGDFRQGVKERDGNTCVLTERDVDCSDAVHLLAHSKGDKYIEAFTWNRIERRNEGDTITDIDDIRNGLFLDAGLHRVFGKTLAFLNTPNFAMESTDLVQIEATARPICVAHYFRVGSTSVASGSRIRMSESHPDWCPPAALFDAIYASVVVQCFGVKTAQDYVSQMWGETFYPDGGGVPQAKAANLDAKNTTATAKTAEQAHWQARADRAKKRAKNRGFSAQDDGHRKFDVWDYLMLLPTINIPPDDVRAFWAETEEKKKEEEHKRVHEKVTMWRENAF